MEKEELKTLKDMEEEVIEFLRNTAGEEAGRYIGGVFLILSREKAEAVKDYKDEIQMYPHIFNSKEQQEAVRRYIKWKNNLTEEDL